MKKIWRKFGMVMAALAVLLLPTMVLSACQDVSATEARHLLTLVEKKDATCTANGNSAYYTCSECDKYFADPAGVNELIKDSWVIYAHHQLGALQEPVVATCSTEGRKAHYECQVCGALFDLDKQATTVDALAIAKHEHVIRAVPAVDAEYVKISGRYSWDSLSCVKGGTKAYWQCEVCEQAFEDADATKPIIYLATWRVVQPKAHQCKLTPAVLATCETAGKDAYYTCTGCQKKFIEATAETEIVPADFADWGVQPALDHDWQATSWYDNWEGGRQYPCDLVCAHDDTHVQTNVPVTVYPNDTAAAVTLDEVLNPTSTSIYQMQVYHLALVAGDYDQIVVKMLPNSNRRYIKELVIDGQGATTTVDGLKFDTAVGEKYRAYTVDNLVIKNLTMTRDVDFYSELIKSDLATLCLSKVTFENVIFDLTAVAKQHGASNPIAEGTAADFDAALDFRCGDNVVKMVDSLTITDCKFINCAYEICAAAASGSDGLTTENTTTKGVGVRVYLGAQHQPQVQIIIARNTFEHMGFNALQLAGEVNYTGTWQIVDNDITDTGDRAIWLGNLAATAKVTITGNIMQNASDAAGELLKANIVAVTDGETTVEAELVISDNYYGALTGVETIRGLCNGVQGEAATAVYADVAPLTNPVRETVAA